MTHVIFEDRLEPVEDAEARLLAVARERYVAGADTVDDFEAFVGQILDPVWLDAHREMLIDAPPLVV